MRVTPEPKTRTTRRPLLPTVYRALVELSQLRDAVTALHGHSDAEAARLLAKIEATELYAVALLQRLEGSSTVVAH